MARDDGLDEQDERVDCVAEAVEDEEFPLVSCEADFIYSGIRDFEACGYNEVWSIFGVGVGLVIVVVGGWRTDRVVDEMHLYNRISRSFKSPHDSL